MRRRLDPVIAANARPLLRGWLHLVCFVLSLPAGVVVVAEAGPARARVAAVVYAVGCSALFGVSAGYHRGHWSPGARSRMQRLDHATIFVMIAGCYTPICLIALRGATGTAILVGAWAGAAVCFALTMTGTAIRRPFGAVCYLALGWLVVVALPEMAARLSPTQFVLIATGGVIYTVGSVVLAARWPDPFPRVFGYHEVWHTMVAGACVCQYIAISTVLRSA